MHRRARRRPSLPLAVAAVLAGCTPTSKPTGEKPAAVEKTGEQGKQVAPEGAGPPVVALPPSQWPESTPATQEDRKAPLSLTASDGAGLRLVSLVSRGVVDAPLAFTELHLVFENPEDRTLEGRFEIEMPPGAAISRFAMKIEGRWQEGEVVERQAARVAYEDFLHRRQDPALLENNAGNSFSARVFPIGPRARKELIIAYSQELARSDEPYRVMLRGLPELDTLDASVIVREPADANAPSSNLGGAAVQAKLLEVRKQKWKPDRDLEVKVARPGALGLRHGRLALARVAPAGEMPAARVGSLVVLFDTSASRSLDLERQIARLKDVLKDLRERTGEDFPLRIVAFDQGTAPMFAGRVDKLGDRDLERLRARRALGASDLARALQSVAEAPAGATRLLVVSDGIATAGAHEVAGLREAGKLLARAGIERADAIVVGGIQDTSALKAITTADLPQDGVVIDGRLPAPTIADKLRTATLPPLSVAVRGATWAWPGVIEGVQPGDEVLVYADLPEELPMSVTLTGQGDDAATKIEVPVAATQTERPLLERAWIRAQIERLQAERSALPTDDAKGRADLKKTIVDLSTRFRVLSDFTALLVLETEEDYRRFGIDRVALADILTVGATGVALQHRTDVPLPPKPEPEPAIAEETKEEALPEAKAARPERREMKAAEPEAEGSEAEEDDGPAGEVALREPPKPEPVELEQGSAEDEKGRFESDAKRAAPMDVGGLGLVGTGRGGGGTGEGTIGLGNTGLIGSGSGYGRGAGAGFGGRGGSGVSVRQAQAEVVGSMDRDIIRRIVRAHINEVRFCYLQSLAKNPQLGGRVVIDWVIGDSGAVLSSTVKEDTLADPQVGSCIAVAVKRWRFPRATDATSTAVTYPFMLSSDGNPVEDPGDQFRPVVEEYEEDEEEFPRVEPYTGRFLAIHQRLRRGERKGALIDALAWLEESPGDVLALVAIGEAAEALGDVELAARAYGSIIDLFPARADLRRYAGARLERLGSAGLALAIDTFEKAAESRPDHPASHRMLAFALVKAGRPREAFEALSRGLDQKYPSDRFAGHERILREDLGLVAAAWRRAEPKAAADIEVRLAARAIEMPQAPSTRFVITWETDANDVDFHVRDGKRGHAYYAQQELPSGGELYEDVTTGYGPECFTIPGTPGAFPYTLQAHYYSRGPMGYGMGKLQIVQHDGKGGLRFEERPFIIMQDDAFVDLGRLTKPL